MFAKKRFLEIITEEDDRHYYPLANILSVNIRGSVVRVRYGKREGSDYFLEIPNVTNIKQIAAVLMSEKVLRLPW
jgi:hypothetical protein